MYLIGSISPREWAILRVVRPTEKHCILCRGVRSKRDHSIVNDGTTCYAAFRQNSFNQSIVSLIKVGIRNLYNKNTNINVENGENDDKTQMSTRWLYCVECPHYSIRLEALGYI